MPELLGVVYLHSDLHVEAFGLKLILLQVIGNYEADQNGHTVQRENGHWSWRWTRFAFYPTERQTLYMYCENKMICFVIKSQIIWPMPAMLVHYTGKHTCMRRRICKLPRIDKTNTNFNRSSNVFIKEKYSSSKCHSLCQVQYTIVKIKPKLITTTTITNNNSFLEYEVLFGKWCPETKLILFQN